MILKRIALLFAFVIGSASAQAATLDTVEAVIGGPVITDTGQATASSAGVTFLGDLIFDPFLPPAPAGQLVIPMGPIVPVTSTATFGVVPDQFLALDFFGGLPVLQGSLLDLDDGAGFVQGLFSTDPIGSAAAAFGSLFRVTISSVSFNDMTLDAAPDPFALPVSATLLVESVVAPPAIPLPAGLWLVLTGLGGFFALRRRTA